MEQQFYQKHSIYSAAKTTRSARAVTAKTQDKAVNAAHVVEPETMVDPCKPDRVTAVASVPSVDKVVATSVREVGADASSGSAASSCAPTEHVCKMQSDKAFTIDESFSFIPRKKHHRLLGYLHRVTANMFLRLYLNAFHRVKVDGKENLNHLKHTGFVVVSNHIHPLDIQMVMVKLFGVRRVHWLTLERNFHLSARSLIRNSGGVPIPEDSAYKKKFFAEIDGFLKEGGVLHVCPEGSLVDLHEGIRPFKDGAFKFCANNHVPLLPVVITFETARRGKPLRRPRFTIHVGNPSLPDETLPHSARVEKLRQDAFRFMSLHFPDIAGKPD